MERLFEHKSSTPWSAQSEGAMAVGPKALDEGGGGKNVAMENLFSWRNSLNSVPTTRQQTRSTHFKRISFGNRHKHQKKTKHINFSNCQPKKSWRSRFFQRFFCFHPFPPRFSFRVHRKSGCPWSGPSSRGGGEETKISTFHGGDAIGTGGVGKSQHDRFPPQWWW